MASLDIAVYGAEERGKVWRRKRRGWKRLGRMHYHVKEMLNLITSGLISSKFVKSKKKQMNKNIKQTN